MHHLMDPQVSLPRYQRPVHPSRRGPGHDPVSQLLPVCCHDATFFLSLSDSIFGSWHREGAYMHLTNAKDVKALAAVRAFNPYDLYSKSDKPVDMKELRPYYEGLIAKFFPPELDW
jgi:hypothetical protein